MFSQLFNNDLLSKSYLSRPDYPTDIVNRIIKFWQQSNMQQINQSLDIVDVGCGTGQMTLKLVKYAHKLTGIDTSKSQIEEARQRLHKELHIDNTQFVLGSYETLPSPDLSVDLITCAQAIHWFDIDKFYAEVDRCLKPGGVLSILTYGRGYFLADCEASVLAEMRQFMNDDLWFDDKYLGPFITEKPRWAWSFLPGLRILYPVNSLKLDNLNMDLEFSLQRYGEYLRSSSMYYAWKKSNLDKEDIVDVALTKILGYLGNPPSGMLTELNLRLPLCMIMCSKPHVKHSDQA